MYSIANPFFVGLQQSAGVSILYGASVCVCVWIIRFGDRPVSQARDLPGPGQLFISVDDEIQTHHPLGRIGNTSDAECQVVDTHFGTIVKRIQSRIHGKERSGGGARPTAVDADYRLACVH